MTGEDQSNLFHWPTCLPPLGVTLLFSFTVILLLKLSYIVQAISIYQGENKGCVETRIITWHIELVM